MASLWGKVVVNNRFRLPPVQRTNPTCPQWQQFSSRNKGRGQERQKIIEDWQEPGSLERGTKNKHPPGREIHEGHTKNLDHSQNVVKMLNQLWLICIWHVSVQCVTSSLTNATEKWHLAQCPVQMQTAQRIVWALAKLNKWCVEKIWTLSFEQICSKILLLTTSILHRRPGWQNWPTQLDQFQSDSHADIQNSLCSWRRKMKSHWLKQTSKNLHKSGPPERVKWNWTELQFDLQSEHASCQCCEAVQSNQRGQKVPWLAWLPVLNWNATHNKFVCRGNHNHGTETVTLKCNFAENVLHCPKFQFFLDHCQNVSFSTMLFHQKFLRLLPPMGNFHKLMQVWFCVHGFPFQMSIQIPSGCLLIQILTMTWLQWCCRCLFCCILHCGGAHCDWCLVLHSQLFREDSQNLKIHVHCPSIFWCIENGPCKCLGIVGSVMNLFQCKHHSLFPQSMCPFSLVHWTRLGQCEMLLSIKHWQLFLTIFWQVPRSVHVPDTWALSPCFSAAIMCLEAFRDCCHCTALGVPVLAFCHTLLGNSCTSAVIVFWFASQILFSNLAAENCWMILLNHSSCDAIFSVLFGGSFLWSHFCPCIFIAAIDLITCLLPLLLSLEGKQWVWWYSHSALILLPQQCMWIFACHTHAFIACEFLPAPPPCIFVSIFPVPLTMLLTSWWQKRDIKCHSNSFALSNYNFCHNWWEEMVNKNHSLHKLKPLGHVIKKSWNFAFLIDIHFVVLQCETVEHFVLASQEKHRKMVSCSFSFSWRFSGRKQDTRP